jgi:hypothetical protein
MGYLARTKLVLSQGGPPLAVFTCLAAVVVAGFAGTSSAKLLDRILSKVDKRQPAIVESDPYSF